jgi:hypothetical protein
MNSPRQTCKVRLSPRDLKDSPEPLRITVSIINVQDIGVEIDICVSSPETMERVESSTAEAAMESAQNALDLQNQAIRAGRVRVEPPEKTKVETHQWLKTLRQEGIRIVGDILVGYITDRITR